MLSCRSEAVEIQENTLNNFQSFLGEEHVLNDSMAASIHKDGRFVSIKNNLIRQCLIEVRVPYYEIKQSCTFGCLCYRY
jgi:hypothetical protein